MCFGRRDKKVERISTAVRLARAAQAKHKNGIATVPARSMTNWTAQDRRLFTTVSRETDHPAPPYTRDAGTLMEPEAIMSEYPANNQSSPILDTIAAATAMDGIPTDPAEDISPIEENELKKPSELPLRYTPASVKCHRRRNTRHTLNSLVEAGVNLSARGIVSISPTPASRFSSSITRQISPVLLHQRSVLTRIAEEASEEGLDKSSAEEPRIGITVSGLEEPNSPTNNLDLASGNPEDAENTTNADKGKGRADNEGDSIGDLNGNRVSDFIEQQEEEEEQSDSTRPWAQ